MAKRVLSEEEIEQRREAGRASAARRRVSRPPQNAQQRLERHTERQETEPLYRAQTTDVIINQKLPVQLASAGGALGLAGGLGLGYAVSPPSGRFFPFRASQNKNLVTRATRATMRGIGAAAGWTSGSVANETLGAVSRVWGAARRARGKNGPVPFDWDATARRSDMSRIGRNIGAFGGEKGYNVYATVKGGITNVLHAATGRRRLATGLILGAPIAIPAAQMLYGMGRSLGESIAPYFPQEVRKNMNTVRLRKSLGFAVRINKDFPMEARGRGRPRGRALSAEEIEQRRDAARASAAKRRERAAAELNMDPSEVNSQGLPRLRTYTPRVREEGQGTFRRYDDSEAEFIRRARIEDRLARRAEAEGEASMDYDGKLRSGTGAFRASRRDRTERTFDRFLGETLLPGYGRHAAKIIGGGKEASDVSDPAAKYGIIGGSVGLAAGGLLGSTTGQRLIGNNVDYAYRRTVPRIQGMIHRGAAAMGLVKPMSDRRMALQYGRAASGQVSENIKPGFFGIKGAELGELASRRIVANRSGWGSKLMRRFGRGIKGSFGATAFVAPAIGALGYQLGRRFGTSLRDDDFAQRRIDTQQRDIDRRRSIGGR